MPVNERKLRRLPDDGVPLTAQSAVNFWLFADWRSRFVPGQCRRRSTTMLATALAHTLLYRSEQWKDLAKPTLVAAVLPNLPGITFLITIATGFRWY